MLSVVPSADDRLPSHSRPEVDDEALVRRAQLGSSAAFEQLVLSYGPRVYRYLAVRLRDDGAALDALQETLTAAWQGLPRLKQPGRFWPWLVGIAAHKAADAARLAVPAGGQDVDLPAPSDDGLPELWDALASLPARFREVLLLRHFLGLSEEETAKALGVRLGTVKSRSARARRALLEQLR
jgi:RNA polymerase sigma factor (sigma-70 family)